MRNLYGIIHFKKLVMYTGERAWFYISNFARIRTEEHDTYKKTIYEK